MNQLSNTVDVWLVWSGNTGESMLSAFRSVMNKAEREREFRFYREQDRQSHVIARGLARNALSMYAPVAPSAWEFSENFHGRPEISAPPGYAGLKFNLSHTEGLVACAVTDDMEVGVDVESFDRDVDFDGIAERFFASEEMSDLALLPPDRKSERFFAYWTLKESYIKARGVGLSLSTSRFAFFLEEDTSGALFPAGVRFDADMNENPDDWQFVLKRAGLRHFAAVSVRTGGAETNVNFKDFGF